MLTRSFLHERIACTAANGFEDGKSYTIYIEATVNSHTGGISYGFRAQTPFGQRRRARLRARQRQPLPP